MSEQLERVAVDDLEPGMVIIDNAQYWGPYFVQAVGEYSFELIDVDGEEFDAPRWELEPDVELLARNAEPQDVAKYA